VSGAQLDVSEPGVVRSVLFLPPLKRSDWPMTLTCSASNWDRGRTLEQSINVDMERELIIKLLRLLLLMLTLTL
jgi:hypothetical protein